MAFIHNETLDQWLTQIQKDTNHRYVRQTIGEVQVPVFFVQVLQWLLRDVPVNKEKVGLYIVATTLVKMGTDMHEHVSVGSPACENKQKQQLTILTGDHYSSLFYLYLARHHETEGIRCLADVTCRVNEWKMSLHSLLHHESEDRDMEKIWHYSEKIATAWITALADFFHVKEKTKVQIAKALVTLHEAAERNDSGICRHEVWMNHLKKKKEFLQEACLESRDPFLTFLIEQLSQTESAVSKESDEA